MSAVPAAPRVASAEDDLDDLDDLDALTTAYPVRTGWRVLPARMAALSVVELQKIRHDRSEIYSRAVTPLLWLAVYGETFTKIHAIPTGTTKYLDYLAPGIIAQSAMFIAIFYGIQIIWERDAGVLTKLMVTPTPRAALVAAKAFASGAKAVIQAVVVLILATILGAGMTWNPLKLLGVLLIVVLGSGTFACLSMSIAGIVLTRDRLMGIGQAITMPLFFTSSALYPISVMPGWLQPITRINPLTYEVDALRSLLIGTATDMPLNVGVLIGSSILMVTCASLLLPRLAKG
jgi:ABC-2 type transport system permease protein